MSNVKLSIGGRDFSVACAAGQEAHVAMLGREIDGRLRTMGGASGSSESRMLLFAALLLADELHEARQGEPTPTPPVPVAADPDQSERLCMAIESAAERVEKLARHLEEAAGRA